MEQAICKNSGEGVLLINPPWKKCFLAQDVCSLAGKNLSLPHLQYLLNDYHCFYGITNILK